MSHHQEGVAVVFSSLMQTNDIAHPSQGPEMGDEDAKEAEGPGPQAGEARTIEARMQVCLVPIP